MNQNKKKMMKSKLKYYAQVIGVNLLAALVPILGVILIYGIGKLKSIYTNPYAISQEIYDCCLWAIIVVLAGFFVVFWLLSWADNWRKTKLNVLKIKHRCKREEEELAKKICFAMGVEPTKDRVEPKVDRTEQENTPASDDPAFEDISGLMVREIYQLYHGREVLITVGKNKNVASARIAGYDEECSILYLGFLIEYFGTFSPDEINTMRGINPEGSYIETGYKSYDCYIPSLIRIYK